MESQSKRFYSPLKDQEIRVLNVLPGDWATPLRCKLSTVVQGDGVAFAALSYSWGTGIQDVSIYMDAQERCIGRSLDTALRYYRQAGWQMPLWIDALCINQSDNAEKSAQVAVMDRIYSLAAGVFVFLGAGFDLSTDNYLEKVVSLRDFRFHAYSHGLSRGMLPSSWEKNNLQMMLEDVETLLLFDFFEGAINLKRDDHLRDGSRWGVGHSTTQISEYPWQTLIQALERFTQAAWWTRVWTLQESVVGKEPTLFYGTAAMPWDMICNAVDSMRAHINECCNHYLINDSPPGFDAAVKRLVAQVQGINHTRLAYIRMHDRTKTNQLAINRVSGIRTNFESPATVEINGSLSSRILYEFLRMHQRRGATDSRDKVYALLSLAKFQDSQLVMYPNYSTMAKDVYINATRVIIEGSGSLDLLSAAGRFRSIELPSWVPDWAFIDNSNDNETQITALLAYDATFGTKVVVQFDGSDPSVLSAEGVVFDSIKAVGEAATPDSRDIWQTIFEWMNFAHSHAPDILWLGFCRTIFTDLKIWPYSRVFRRMGTLTKEMIQSEPVV